MDTKSIIFDGGPVHNELRIVKIVDDKYLRVVEYPPSANEVLIPESRWQKVLRFLRIRNVEFKLPQIKIHLYRLPTIGNTAVYVGEEPFPTRR